MDLGGAGAKCKTVRFRRRCDTSPAAVAIGCDRVRYHGSIGSMQQQLGQQGFPHRRRWSAAGSLELVGDRNSFHSMLAVIRVFLAFPAAVAASVISTNIGSMRRS